MVHKFIRDHAWKFPSRPTLPLECGAERVLENAPELVPGGSGGLPVNHPP